MSDGVSMKAEWKRGLAPTDPVARRAGLKALAIVIAGGGLMMAVLIYVFLTRMPWPNGG